VWAFKTLEQLFRLRAFHRQYRHRPANTMSYRELRNFTELMRALGYPRLISLENFRKPNFELVADVLYWMVKLYEPDTVISDRVEFENERVEFLTSIAQLMATKARLKLNTKKLYASDGRAVQELLKLATLLYSASKSSNSSSSSSSTTAPTPQPIKLQEVRAARQLASEITQTGAKVYDLLANEASERRERERAIRFLDQAASATDGSREQQYIERSIRELIDGTKQAVADMKKECEELEQDERNIDMKIKKKQEELERTEKRLRSLENVRPQFMDEVEKLGKVRGGGGGSCVRGCCLDKSRLTTLFPPLAIPRNCKSTTTFTWKSTATWTSWSTRARSTNATRTSGGRSKSGA